MFREALPFAFAGFLNPLVQSADKALLLYLLGTEELGLYVVALTASSVANSLASAAGTVTFSISTQQEDRQGFERVARVFRFTALTWLLAGSAVAALIPFLLPLIYGRDFSSAIWPAMVLVPAAAFAGQAGILEEAMRAQGRAFLGLTGRLWGLVILLSLGWILGRAWGILGVAVAAIGAQAVVLFVMMFAARKHFHNASLRALMPQMVDAAELIQRSMNRLSHLK